MTSIRVEWGVTKGSPADYGLAGRGVKWLAIVAAPSIDGSRPLSASVIPRPTKAAAEAAALAQLRDPAAYRAEHDVADADVEIVRVDGIPDWDDNPDHYDIDG